MNSGEEQETAITEKEVQAEKPAVRSVVGGEVHIVADPITGEVSVHAPQNMLVALGIIEVAKMSLITQHIESQRRASQRAELIRASAADLGRLARPS